MLKYFLVSVLTVSFIQIQNGSANEIAKGIVEALKHISDEKFKIDDSVSKPLEPNNVRSQTEPPKVKTEQGLLTGVTFTEAHGFYGVPYGEEVSGENRFKIAKPASNYNNSELDVGTNNFIACMQYNQCNGCAIKFVEECLVLNIHVPINVDLTNSTAPPSERLPVMFWIHGGGFNIGAGSFNIYDGRYLSNVTNTIVVSVNYRLASLGFLVYSDENETIKGNQALKDQQLALEWVHQNIHKFGGDKNKVTLFGQSAGAQSVMFHLLSNVSEPLFNNAIVQSNPAAFKYPDIEEAKEVTDRFMEALNCTEKGITCLRNVDSEKLNIARFVMSVQALQDYDIFGVVEPFRPVIDGVEYTDDPIKLFQQGRWHSNKDVIMGATSEEMIFVPAYIPNAVRVNEDQFRKLNSVVFGKVVGDKATDFYVEKAGNPGKLFDYKYVLGEEMGDSLFVCPSRTMARFASDTAQNSDVYFYTYAHGPNDTTCTSTWVEEACGHAFHSAENIPVFRTDPLVAYDFDEEDWNVADQLSYFWGNFAHSGNPNSGDVTDVTLENFSDWPVYVSPEPWSHITIDYPAPSTGDQLIEEVCNFWDSTGFFLNDITPPEPTTSSVETTASSEANTTSQSEPTTVGAVETTTTGGGNNLNVSLLVNVMLMLLSLVISY